MMKKVIKLNLDDLFLYLGVEGGVFLVIQIIIGCVMYFGRPGTSVTVACVVYPPWRRASPMWASTLNRPSASVRPGSGP